MCIGNRFQRDVQNDFTDCLIAEGESLKHPYLSKVTKCRKVDPDGYEEWKSIDYHSSPT